MASYTKRTTKTKGVVWDVRAWYEGDGERRQVRLSGFSTKKEAQKAIREYFDARMSDEAPVRKNVTLAEAYEEYAKARESVLAASSMMVVACAMRVHVLPDFVGCGIDLKRADIVDWRDRMWNKTSEKTGKPYSQAMLTKVWAVFHTFMDWVSEKYGVVNPFLGVKIPRRREQKKEMNVWTAEEFDKFLSAVDSPRNRLFFRMLFYSGARKGEISALTVDDVVKCGNVYTIKISKTAFKCNKGRGMIVTPPKTPNANRTVTLPECLTEELDEYLDGKEGYIFGGEKPTAPTCFNAPFARAIEKSGVNPIRIHDLRHSHASILIAAGVPVTAVSKRLGHTSPNITLGVYSHCLEKSDEEIISVLNALPIGKK